MKTIIYNIGTLAGILPAGVRKLEGEQMGHVECLRNAYLVIENGVISDFGSGNGTGGFQNNPSHADGVGPSPCGQGGSTVLKPTGSVPASTADEWIDAKGGFVMPCFCDSHTHIVYAGCSQCPKRLR